VVTMSGNEGPDFKAVESSANRNESSDVHLGKSLIYIKNKIGPSILPWIVDMSSGGGLT
jgi:hypothetical protein